MGLLQPSLERVSIRRRAATTATIGLLAPRLSSWPTMRRRVHVVSLVLGLAVCGSQRARSEAFRGIDFPCGVASFADSVVEFRPGLPRPELSYRGAENAIGTPSEEQAGVCPCADGCSYVSLGKGGSITLGFRDNVLTGDGTSDADLWVFEVGPWAERVFVEVSKDGHQWIDVGVAVGERKGIDLDSVGFGAADEFRFVRLTDDPIDGGTSGPTVGADIDAVGAVSCRVLVPGLLRDAHRSRLIAWGQRVSPYSPTPPGESIPAIRRCYDTYGYDGVEMDVRITSDGVPVLLHDDVIAPRGVPFTVSEHTYAELREFSFGEWEGEVIRVASLEEALRANAEDGLFLADMRVSEHHANKVKDAVDSSGCPVENVEITAYSIVQGIGFKKVLPSAQVVVKQYKFPEEFSRDLIDHVAAAGLDGIMLKMPEGGESMRGFTDYAHWKGLTVTTFVHYSWNALEDLQQLVDDGVDNILTVHSAYRELLEWPNPEPPPRLHSQLHRESGTIQLSWNAARPYAFRIESSSPDPSVI